MDMYFLLDTILNFRLGYVISYSSIPGGPQKPGMTAVEMAPRKVAQRYLRTWFLPDLLGSLPYDLIGWNSDKRAEGVKLLGLLRVFKVMRLNRMQRFFRWDPAGFMYVAGKVGISSLWMLLFTHFSACMFYYVARLQPPNPDGAWIYGQMVTNDNMAVPISEGTPPQQYISALYFAFIAITSVGFGDVHPGNTVPERIWVSVQITVGNFIMAYVLAEITSLMLDAHARDRLAFLRTAALQDFFKAQANMPDWLQRRITEHYDKRWGSKETEVLEQEITETMPRALKLELSVGWWTAKVKPSVLLPHDRSFLRAFLAHAEIHDIKPMQAILEQGSSRGMGHLYVILSGVVACSQQSDEQCRRQHTEPPPKTHLERTERSESGGLNMHSIRTSSSLTLRTLPIDLEEDIQDYDDDSTFEEHVGSDHEPTQSPVGQGKLGDGTEGSASNGEATLSTLASKSPHARASGRQDMVGTAPELNVSASSRLSALFPRTGGVPEASHRSPTSGVRRSPGHQLAQSGGVSAPSSPQVGKLAAASDMSGDKAAGAEMDVKTWDLGEGALLGESVLQFFLNRPDMFFGGERAKRIRRRSMFTARSQTAVRLSVIPMEDALETILSFPSLFKPLIHSVHVKSPRK
eukprot:jgi/Mesvir1/4784/Mv11084-RA.1